MSLTYSSVLVLVIVSLGKTVGVEILEGDVQTTVTVIVQVVSALTALYGRYRAGGITALGTRA